MIDLKLLRNSLKVCYELTDDKITIKRKKKMVIEQTTNGNVKAKRRSYIKIEIIE